MTAAAIDRVQTAQCEFAYVESGAGTAVLLLHDGDSSHADWDEVIPALARSYRVLAVDRPGCGASGRPREGYGRTTQGRALSLFLRAVGEERLGVVGHGLGGALALELAAAVPYAVDRLALISPVTSGLDVATASELAAQGDLYSTAGGPAERAQKVANSFIRTVEARARYVASYVQGTNSSDPTLTGAMLADAAKSDDAPLLRALRCPTLVVRPGRDATFSEERARRIVELAPQGMIATLPDSGHFPQLDDPASLSRILLEFLGRPSS